MKMFSMLIIIAIIFSSNFDNCAAEGVNDIIHEDSTKQNFWNRTINLQRRLEPIDRVINFLPDLLPVLTEPSIIHINILHLPQSVSKENVVSPLGIKDNVTSHKLTNKPNTTDTLINGLFQSISLDKKVYKQGEIATLNVTTVLPLIKPQIKFLKKTYKLYPAGKNSYRTILAVPMNADTGRYYMTLKYEEENRKKSLRLPFKVISGDFAGQDTMELDIPVLTDETLEMMKYESRYFSKAYKNNFDTLMCEGDFIWPCAGFITSMYGMARRYNNGLDKWSHKAIDIANAVGTKIVAANSGVVAMTEELEAHGKSIVIAHGQGIHTVYIHLNKIKVAAGDTVMKGQVIGEMGRTGICSGSNLHFQIMVNSIPTDPRCWIPNAGKLKKGDYINLELADK
ncbi:MAG: M23 family metallopeptidase [bacterium]